MSLNHFCTGVGSGGIFNPRFNTLTVDNGIVNSAQPWINAQNTTAQTISSSTTTSLSTYTSISATGTGISYSSGTFTTSSDGTFLLEVNCPMTAAATGLRTLNISINGTVVAYQQLDASATAPACLSLSIVRFITSGSTITFNMSQNSGGNLNCNFLSACPGNAQIFKLA